MKKKWRITVRETRWHIKHENIVLLEGPVIIRKSTLFFFFQFSTYKQNQKCLSQNKMMTIDNGAITNLTSKFSKQWNLNYIT